MSKQHWIDLIYQRRQTRCVSLPDDAAARLHKLPGIRAVVFDVYGTLFSSGVGDISLATEQNRDAELKATLEANGITLNASAQDQRFDDRLHAIIHRHQDVRRVDGIVYPEVDIRKVWAELIHSLVEEGCIEIETAESIETLAVDYESRVNPTQPMPGLKTVLTNLTSRGVIMSIISNAQFHTPLLFETYLKKTAEYFGFCMDCSVWSYVELEGKPSPRLYRIAAERLMQHHGLQPREVLYVGNDIRNDIWPARTVGFKTALFAGDRLSLRRRAEDPDCHTVRADIEITRLEQILSCL
jgi:putative hydrolase of the HAD superfamily